MTENQIIETIQKLPVSTQFALVNSLSNIPYGANWGLCSRKEVEDKLESIKKDKNIFLIPIQGGVIMQLARGYLETVVMQTCPGVIQQGDISKMAEKQLQAQEDLRKHLKKFSKQGGGTSYLGIYCVNLTPIIKIKEKDYPAFRVDIKNFLTILAEFGGGVYVGGQVINASILLQNLNSMEVLKQLTASMAMSPSKTGVFIKIVL